MSCWSLQCTTALLALTDAWARPVANYTASGGCRARSAAVGSSCKQGEALVESLTSGKIPHRYFLQRSGWHR